ncbi:competence type IV pilus minor pilin ComGD [Enterococcus timonensis]|uniref:competence type IV pilus minor pilin ComGD n=1 Tax=Enterococcus timonensis TaxID=1852364 RepID=UPI0008DAA381|nr:competence type IV pilus minor pilin ComGD [Enterococcus timonensis]
MGKYTLIQNTKKIFCGKFKKKLSGFTLLESLIVLVAVSVLLLVGNVNFTRARNRLAEEQFIKTFETHYLYTQKMAMITGRQAQINASQDRRSLSFANQTTGVWKNQFVLEVPETIISQSVPKTIFFQGISGRNGSLKSYIWRCETLRLEITYQIQMSNGRYTKREVKI